MVIDRLFWLNQYRQNHLQFDHVRTFTLWLQSFKLQFQVTILKILRKDHYLTSVVRSAKDLSIQIRRRSFLHVSQIIHKTITIESNHTSLVMIGQDIPLDNEHMDVQHDDQESSEDAVLPGSLNITRKEILR